jgi:uncharacterized protein YndB with AHSA1/START domain
MGTDTFVYTTYIKTSPERLWQALTEPAFTCRYWGVAFQTDWRVGSPVVWVENGVKIEHPDQVVLESDPHRRLAYTWHTFAPDWAESHGFDAELSGRLASEPRSKVTFDLEPVGELVKLTVVHDGLASGGTVIEMIREGWPHLLSSLKTLLETGEPLPDGSAEQPQPSTKAG